MRFASSSFPLVHVRNFLRFAYLQETDGNIPYLHLPCSVRSAKSARQEKTSLACWCWGEEMKFDLSRADAKSSRNEAETSK